MATYYSNHKPRFPGRESRRKESVANEHRHDWFRRIGLKFQGVGEGNREEETSTKFFNLLKKFEEEGGGGWGDKTLGTPKPHEVIGLPRKKSWE